MGSAVQRDLNVYVGVCAISLCGSTLRFLRRTYTRVVNPALQGEAQNEVWLGVEMNHDTIETAKILAGNILAALFIMALVIPWCIGVVQVIRWCV